MHGKRAKTFHLRIELVELNEECQRKHKRRYGYRWVTLWLKNEKGMTVNHKKVLRITGKYNLLSVIRRRRLNRYVLNGNLVYENILNRNFHADSPNQKWVTDISYIITPAGTLYFSAIRDLYDNFIVAYKTAKRQDYSLRPHWKSNISFDGTSCGNMCDSEMKLVTSQFEKKDNSVHHRLNVVFLSFLQYNVFTNRRKH